LILQIGTGHVGGIIRNDVYTLNDNNALPDEVEAEREQIIETLFADETSIVPQEQLLQRQVRVIKYYHSIDATRSDDGQNRYTNSNLPGPHVAWAVFLNTATRITDQPCYKIEPDGVNVTFTGLYVPRQRELVQPQNQDQD
jgi:hypothetical protein